MLATVWFAHTFFKLSFGTQDRITQRLDALQLDLTTSPDRLAQNRQVLRDALKACDVSTTKTLMDFVPYRLLRPFLQTHLVHLERNTAIEGVVPHLARTQFDTLRPLYRFDHDDHRQCSAVFFHPDWARYLEIHNQIIQGWTAWHWLHYMQKRNPSTPALAHKLFAPSKREALSRQTRYWRDLLTHADSPMRCVYSGTPLQADEFALDHYLPWSFIAHDQLWNLIPTLPSINSAKSNRLPSSIYLDELVQLQHRGLQVAQSIFSPRQFTQFADDFISDLQLPSQAALLDAEQLRKAYERTVNPLMTLATNQGFSPDWRCLARD